MSLSDADLGSQAPLVLKDTDSDSPVQNGFAPEASTAQRATETPATATVPEGLSKNAPGTTCGVCNKSESKYLCGRCSLPFCSVACNTLHRATHPATGDEAISAESKVEAHPPKSVIAKPVLGTVSAAGASNPFSVLQNSQDLKTLFMKYPQLRSQLLDIYNTTLPPSGTFDNNYGHHQEISPSYRGHGRGRGGHPAQGRDRGPWNTDRGTQDGIDSLNEQSQQFGRAGEGIREYSELVLKLVSLEGVDVAKLVQQEVAEENAKIISQLLNGDSY